MISEGVDLVAGPYVSNGVYGVHPFSFPCSSKNNITVTTEFDGVETIRVLDSEYTVSLNADQNGNPGGTITFSPVPVANTNIVIESSIPVKQSLDFTQGGAFNPDTLERALDDLALLIGQVRALADRALKIQVTSTDDPDDLIASVFAAEASAAASASAAAGSAFAAANVVSAGDLGFMPVDVAGDTMTGQLEVPSFVVNGSAAITTLGNAATKTTGTASGQVPLNGASKSASKTMAGVNFDLPQLQPLGAAISAGKLVITLNETTIDFRAGSLLDGTINRAQITTPLTLEVSSGSTLGMVNGVAATLVVIATEYYGAVQLGIVNIAGGVSLDETYLISTTAEGGVGAADSDSVIYTTTALTNVPFRVIGYIDITQATAGSWVSNPTRVQGSGGQAMTSLQSIGNGQTWQTGGRSLATTYYNTTSKPILVSVTAVGTASVSYTQLNATVDGVLIARSVSTNNGSATYTNVVFIVPPGMSYSVTQTGTGSLSLWAELRT